MPGHCLCSALHSPLIFQSSPKSDKGGETDSSSSLKTPAVQSRETSTHEHRAVNRALQMHKANLYNWGVLQAGASILHGAHPAWFTTCTDSFSFLNRIHQFQNEAPAYYWEGEKNVGRNWAGRSPPAVRWVLICCWHPQQSLLSYPTRLPHPPANPSFLRASCSTLSLCFPPQTGELLNCPWALLVPAPLKRLVTQASSGPRVWKLLIEGCLQPEWQTQGHCSVVVAVCCSCLCGGLRECPVESRQWAMVITRHSSQRFLSLCPDHRQQKS